MRTQTAAPTRKTLAGTGGAGVGYALAELAVWGLEQWRDLPPNIEFAVTVLVVGAVSFAAAYWTSPAPGDRVVPG